MGACRAHRAAWRRPALGRRAQRSGGPARLAAPHPRLSAAGTRASQVPGAPAAAHARAALRAGGCCGRPCACLAGCPQGPRPLGSATWRRTSGTRPCTGRLSSCRQASSPRRWRLRRGCWAGPHGGHPTRRPPGSPDDVHPLPESWQVHGDAVGGALPAHRHQHLRAAVLRPALRGEAQGPRARESAPAAAGTSSRCSAPPPPPVLQGLPCRSRAAPSGTAVWRSSRPP